MYIGNYLLRARDPIVFQVNDQPPYHVTRHNFCEIYHLIFKNFTKTLCVCVVVSLAFPHNTSYYNHCSEHLGVNYIFPATLKELIEE